jgi:hypothetical protein
MSLSIASLNTRAGWVRMSSNNESTKVIDLTRAPFGSTQSGGYAAPGRG